MARDQVNEEVGVVSADGGVPCGTTSVRRWPALCAALLTTLTAMVVDASSGTDPWHTMGLGAVALAVALVRLHRFGRRHRIIVGLLCGLVVAQPLMHLVVSSWHQATSQFVPHGPQWMHGLLLVGHLVPAGALLLAVALADVLLLAGVERATRLLHMLLPLQLPTPQHGPRPCTVTFGPVGELSTWVEYARRRGPPGRCPIPA